MRNLPLFNRILKKMCIKVSAEAKRGSKKLYINNFPLFASAERGMPERSEGRG